MTTAQTMLARLRSLCGALLLAAMLTGCAMKPDLVAPRGLIAPYDTSGGEVLWAVVPLRNESGTSLTDAYEISDKVVAAAAQVQGVRALPLNRTISTMRALRMTDLATPADAKRLATELGVDGLIVGSITAWDPYTPKLGMALALYARPGALAKRGVQPLDTRKLEYQATDYHYFPRSSFETAPASVVSVYLDGKNHQVLMDAKSYAEGRHDPATGLAWRRYLASMDLFSEFAAWHAVSRLLDHEWLRLARPDAEGTMK